MRKILTTVFFVALCGPAFSQANTVTNWQSGTTGTGAPINVPVSAANPLPVTASITPSGTQDVNLKLVNGAAVNVGTGASSTGTQRVTTSTDSTIGTVTSVTSATVVQPTAANLNATVVGTGTFAVQNTPSSTPNPQCGKVINITQTTTTDVHTFTGIGYICSIVLVSATAQNIGVDEGTGTTCETSGTALIGVSSTSSATPTMAVGVNGGFSSIAGVPWLTMQASGDHLCVLQSGSGNVSGTITYGGT